MNIEIEDAHFESQAASGQSPSRSRSTDDPEDEAAAPAHPTAERLDGAEPAGGGESMAGEQVSAAEEAEEQGHHGVGDLLGAGGVYMDEAKAEVGGECGIDGAVGGAEAEDEVVGAEAALGGAWEISERVEEDGGGGLDLAVGETAERDVLDGGDAGEGFEFEGAIFDAV